MASFCSCCCGQRRRRNVACRSPRFKREQNKRGADVRPSTSVPVYYVKGSLVPVECLRPGIDRDSRLFREKGRKSGARTQRPTTVNADVYMAYSAARCSLGESSPPCPPSVKEVTPSKEELAEKTQDRLLESRQGWEYTCAHINGSRLTEADGKSWKIAPSWRRENSFSSPFATLVLPIRRYSS